MINKRRKKSYRFKKILNKKQIYYFKKINNGKLNKKKKMD